MLLLKRDESTNLPSPSSSSSQPIHGTYMILLLLSSSLLLLPSLTLARHEYAFFNSSSLITVPNFIWDLTATTEITFKTCLVSGNLLSLNGSFLSSSPSTPLPSLNNQELAILLYNSSVVFVWSLNGQTGVVYAGNNINNNRWYTVTLRNLLNSLQFSVVQGSSPSPSNVVVANYSKNSFLLDVRLTGSLKIGEGFYGCLNQGPGVNFSAPGLTDRNIAWDSCPLDAVSRCANDTDDCYLIPCQHGATCVDGVNNYTCVCPRNFNGTHCENDLAALYGCQVQPCMNGGTCSDQIGTTSRRFICSCPQGFTGTICESTIDLCRTNPCQQGVCRSSANSYACNCTGTGYSGVNCSEDINECFNSMPCGQYPCSNRPGGFYCSCPAGYAGAPCKELDECSSMPCQNGGTCTDGLNVFFCNCAPGYTGQMCETDINECDSSPCTHFPNMTCVNLTNNYRCQCLDGFSGDPCRDIDECALNVCRNNATCSNNPGGYSCSCLPGFTGKNCSTVINTCEPNPCLHNATCSGRVNNYTCNCVPGYTGQNCETDIDECSGSPCYNNATCLNQVNSYKCSCVPGWTGVLCLEDIDECQSNPCLFGSECHNNWNSFNCTCRPGYEGLTCGINIDDCNKTQPCKNGGECFDGVNDYSCNCTSNWMGKNCSDEYDACFFKPCLNGANCTTVKPHHDYTCSCVFGFMGMNCETNIDDCVNSRCDSYQRCYDGIGNYTCGCPLGYTGDRCQTEVNECDSEPCKNNGTCDNGHGNYTCTCLNRYINLTDSLGPKGLYLTGYNGTNCDNDINECDYNDPPICQAQGKCDNSPPGGFTCYCKSAKGEFHTGTLCEQVRSYCNIRLPEEVCRNGGTCVDLPLTYKCECVRGFTGKFCENNINECASSPCQYNGTCKDLVNGYVCTCIEGITGQNCETNINDCDPNPCLHGGVCQDLVNRQRFSCNCSGTGFNGTTCENNIDDCVGNQCEHGGKCVDDINDYSCDCLPGYTDRMCAVDIPDCNPNPCAYNSLCLENSNTSLYDKGDPRFVNFTYEKASGYVCVCVPGLQGKNCSVDIDECVSGPCQHNSNCTNIFKDGFTCACSRGYEGLVCQTEINECIVYKPCKNGGICFDKLADYDCVCPTPETARTNYAGKNCTTYLYGCDGSNNKCRNGNCVPQFIGNVHSSFCICNPGFTGAICSESTDISFRGSQNDYIKSQMNMPEFRLSLRFQTTISNAVLLVWKVSPSSYVSIELTNGRVLLKYKSNFNLQFCSLSTLSMLNNSEYHQLNLTVANNITLALPLDHCGDSSCHTRNCQYVFGLAGNSLPSASQVYIGSGVVSGFQNEKFSHSFIGCMADIVINNDLLYPGKHIGEYFGVSPGCTRVAQCGVNSCNGRGFCEDQWDKYVCHCYRPFYGTYATTCDIEYQAATFGIDQESVVIYSRPFPGNIDDWTFSFFITTRQEEGFIVYFGNSESESRKLTYVKLYIKNGKLLGDFYKCGYTRHFDTSREISDGFKHFVSVKITDREFTVNLNSEIVFQDGNVTASLGLCSPEFGFFVSFVKFGQGSITTISRAKRSVNWLEYANEEMFGVSTRSHHLWKRQANSSTVVNMPGFQGVIQDVQINNFKLGFNDTSLTTPSILNATIGAFSTKTVCNDTQCENGGNCTNVFYNDFACSCPPGFIGKNCSTVDHCFFGTCPTSSTCHNLQEGYECASTASFSTDSSIVTYTIAGDTPDPLLTFNFRTRGLYGLIFLLRKGAYYLKVRVANGRLQMNWKLTSDFSVSMTTQQDKLINDGVWYQAKFEVINGTNIKLQVFEQSVLVDETDTVKLVANFSVEDMLRNGEIVLGSSDKIKFSDLWEASYSGCLQNVRMGGQLMPFFRDEVFKNNSARNKFIAQRVENIVNNCDAKDACVGYSCLNGGVCVDLWNDRKCECPVGLEGSLCEDNPNNCASLPCLNGGVCVDGLGTFTCTCPKGFSGNLCQESLDLCNPNNTALCANGSNCTKHGSDFQCECAGPNFTGWYCNVSTHQNCSDGLCQNNGVCTNTIFNISTSIVQSFNCTCKTGYWGPLCEKAIDYCNANRVMCANNGSCTNNPEIQSYTCQCNETLDYAGFNCSQRIDDCSGKSCSIGVCVDGNRSFKCALNDGSSKSSNVTDYCQIKSPCQHGKCTGDSWDPCNCSGSGWTGQGCNLELNECNITEPVCLNGGNCSNSEGSFLCDCPLGYDGKQCEHPNCSGLCQNNGTCGINTTHWWCTCPEYVAGPPLCTDVGPCFHKPCDQDNTVTCTQSLSLTNYTCTCKTGWEGVNCTTDINECSRGPHLCGNGTCFNTNGSYACNCTPGWEGVNCTTDINECSRGQHLCGNGTCFNTNGSYACNCTPGYTGVTCSTDVDECTSNVTICNDGQCINKNGSYECNCPEKDVGHNCELPNPCYNHTMCLNGGVCQHNITQTGFFQCLCPANYEGSTCEKKLAQGNGKDQDLGVIIGPIVGGVVLIILIIVIIAFVMTARSKRATRGAYSPSQQETSGSRVEMGNVLKKPPEERLI